MTEPASPHINNGNCKYPKNMTRQQPENPKSDHTSICKLQTTQYR